VHATSDIDTRSDDVEGAVHSAGDERRGSVGAHHVEAVTEHDLA
jgi:hypothetical protein